MKFSSYLLALVGDLVDSRQTPNRSRFETQLRSILDELSSEFATHVHAPLRLVRGIDEVSGVLNRPDHGFAICARVNERIFPAKIRWGIGWGKIDVNAESGDAGAMDGEAFHLAAKAMERARADRLTYAFELPDASGCDIALLESATQLYSEIVRHWTEKSADVSRAMRCAHTQAQAAKKLDITPQRISQIMKRGSIDELRNFEEVASWKLRKCGE